ncbi:MAG TPA: nickel pincer cofactor biosynthesis protein LarC [Vicinamibacterales bacterium]|nr:nickel pincer cofactor biosynthesis protein LarC [Vicinamibacterales bacterium]
MTVLYFDCFSGSSGDMVLGALIDAGVPLAEVRRALGSLAVDPDAVWTEPVVRTGIRATKFCVRGEDSVHTHSHGHEPHRTLAEIGALIDGSALSVAGKARAKALFCRLGSVEAAIHGVPLEQVHLHEVGALDSIIDIVGAVHALEHLGADRIVASPLNVGSGTVRAAHGIYPVPAPATLQLLAGAPVYAGPQKAEMVTPTGALLISSYASAFGPLPAMTVRTIGYGAGARDLPDAPNVLRVVIGEEQTTADAAPNRVVVIEAEIDDMTPQLFGAVMDALLAAGALDVFYTPVQMKKNRPGTLLTVIAPTGARAALTGLIFRETTTIGVRYRESEREVLDREIVEVSTAVGPIRVKIARQGGAVLNIAPEFDDCVRAAAAAGRPVKDVQALAVRAFHDRPQGASA